MQIKAKVGGNTTSGEFRALAIFFDALAQNKASELIPAPEQPAQLPTAETKVIVSDAPVQDQPQGVEQTAAEVETTRRRRRTKAEIEADEAAKKQAEINNDEAAEAEAKNQETAAAAAETVDTGTGEITTTPVEEFEKVANEPAVTNGKTYSEAEVQTLASVVARTKGAGIVKDKIAELGKARIAELDPNQLNLLGAFLEGQK